VKQRQEVLKPVIRKPNQSARLFVSFYKVHVYERRRVGKDPPNIEPRKLQPPRVLWNPASCDEWAELYSLGSTNTRSRNAEEDTAESTRGGEEERRHGINR